MCILCSIQKWSRRIATMLPWLVIPLIGLWALSQLLPPAFRFEITSPRLACVFVLLVTLLWYEVLMPQLSAWRIRRNARLRERKRSEAIEMQKLRKTATRRCRNCLTPYRDQNPGAGKFMCSYCGHVSKRPVLDLPVPIGMDNAGILKDLVGKGGKILNGKAWDNGWMCGQEWLENGNWSGGPVSGKSSYWDNDHCSAEKSYSRVFIFARKAFTTFFMSIVWLWRKIFRVSSSRDDASASGEGRGISDKQGENVGNDQESRVEKARRKAEEKRQARLEKELLEEEERKQREEVAKLVEERRKLRDEKSEAERERCGKGSLRGKERDSKREAERKRQERRKERDRGSSKSNSDAEELEKRAGKESSEKGKKSEQHRTSTESMKGGHGLTEGAGYGFKGGHNNRGNAGTRYFDRVRGTFLSSSRAFTGGGFFGKSTNTSTVSREHKPSNTLIDHAQTSTHKKGIVQPDRVSGLSNVNADDKGVSLPVAIEPQPYTTPKKSWQQLFTRSSPVSSPPSNLNNVISRPNGTYQAEVHTPPPFSTAQPASTKSFDNPISFGLPSPFASPSFPFGSTSSGSTHHLPISSEAMFPKIGDAPSHHFLPEESEIFEDPCYVPDPVSLLGPVSESLDNFQLDHLAFVRRDNTTTGLEKSSCALKAISAPSPIESPLSRLRVSESSFIYSSTTPNKKSQQDNCENDTGMFDMWNSSTLVQDGLGLVGGHASWLLPSENIIQQPIGPPPHKTMASLFKKDEQVTSAPHQNALFGNFPNGPANSSVDGPWLPKTIFGPSSNNENQTREEAAAARNGLIYGNSSGSAANHQFDWSRTNSWAKEERNVQGSPVSRPPHIGGLYSPPDVQSLWSYD